MPPNQPQQPLSNIPHPTWLDRLAIYLLEGDQGRPKGFVLQTLLEFVGEPTIFSAADLLGLLRGYLNLRYGYTLKGRLEIITALLPFIPTGPVHFFIEKLFPAPAKSARVSPGA